jgi:DNA-binding transcriptional LysR family regulator
VRRIHAPLGQLRRDEQRPGLTGNRIAAGLAAAAEARIALVAADRALIAGRRVAAGTGGRICTARAETMTAWVLVPVLRGWRRRFPDVELDLKEYTSADRMLDVLLAGGADITVGPRPTRTDEHTELLGREEIVVVASPDHRFADLDAVPPAELAAERPAGELVMVYTAPDGPGRSAA